ncbi:MAG TPA: gamma-glutamyl-gamma-aminobutyrate hydrolase family protein [Armatimonadota bacterium]|nr:gamma-glutamyl-gamma-aminobutyrate hydrolase family protein [Armatimonadota bacterium]
MSRPIIGITTGGVPEDPKWGIKKYASYGEATQDAGGEPKFLSPRPGNPSDDLEGIHGLLLTGGLDVHPDFYPSQLEPGDEKLSTDELIAAYRMECNHERDGYEIPLARAAYEQGVPILGICRGFQLLNVALGESLVKDIHTGRKHWAIRQEESDEGPPLQSRKHMITIVPDTKLAQILGDCPILVNSRHHQGVTDRLRSDRLKASAYAPDGIIEALEGIEHPWAVAVQWHPEKEADEYVYEACKPLFNAFVKASIP